MTKTTWWVNFCPKKMLWEAQQCDPKFGGYSSWYQDPTVLEHWLQQLVELGITGVKLNVFNSEIALSEDKIDWYPLDFAIDIARNKGLQLHLCLGPYQYPLWPGIRLPAFLESSIRDEKKELDQVRVIRQFGIDWTTKMLKRYGRSRKVVGFYLGNEWHTAQAIENQSEQQLFSLSLSYMKALSKVCKKHTTKPIILNTNLDASECRQIEHVFQPLWSMLKSQAVLGLDVYPSRETFRHAPKLFLKRQLRAYHAQLRSIKKMIPDHQVIISEFEAQPWGDGRSWAAQIHSGLNTVLYAQAFQQSLNTHLKDTSLEIVTLWGAEYWLVCSMLGREHGLNLRIT